MTDLIYNIKIAFVPLEDKEDLALQRDAYITFFKNNKYLIIKEATRSIWYEGLTPDSPSYRIYKNKKVGLKIDSEEKPIKSVEVSLAGSLRGKFPWADYLLEPILYKISRNVAKAIYTEFSYMPGKLIVRFDFIKPNLLDRLSWLFILDELKYRINAYVEKSIDQLKIAIGFKE